MEPTPACGPAPGRREKIGIFGGTFDPVHRAHIAAARAVRAARGLDRVLLVPAAGPPHKRGEITPFRHRLAMVELAVKGEAGIEASDLEGRRGGVSYTVDTLEEVARARPGAELHFIIGEDTIAELPLWKDLPRIALLGRMVAVNRPGPPRRFDPLLFPGIPGETLRRWESERVEMEPLPLASREVRRRVEAGEPFDHLLPEGVGDYIRRHRLYGYAGADPRRGESP